MPTRFHAFRLCFSRLKQFIVSRRAAAVENMPGPLHDPQQPRFLLPLDAVSTGSTPDRGMTVPARIAAPAIEPPSPPVDAFGVKALPGWYLYLQNQGNPSDDIQRMAKILALNEVILEIGCGSGEVAWQIAARNPAMGVIAVDSYDGAFGSADGSHYGRVARNWRGRLLAVQHAGLDNLVILRAGLELLECLPHRSIDSILMINPEPSVGKRLIGCMAATGTNGVLKPGDRQMVILPYCREMGVCACGGYEFEHTEDWSRGLGYLMASPFIFRKESAVQWGVDLCRGSAYSRNSTQHDVYICGTPPPIQGRPASATERPPG
ncbi:MAG: hypothetical protein ACOWWM_17950 [Desulfobacterales bacterium]